MRKRVVLALLLVCALPLAASQFVKLPFDQVVQSSTLIVRGTVGPVTAAWNDGGEVIFSSANLEVNRYYAGHGPQVLRIREVGGTVGEYTQQAIGFPELREGEEVVLMLTRWDDSDEWRIHAYRQGKFVVRGNRVGEDPIGQGEERFHGLERSSDDSTMMTLDEFEAMVEAAARGNKPVQIRK